MAWRAMQSLIVLRGQVDAEAPNRSKTSDGLVGDSDHQQNNPGSGHNPHYVAGVGDEIVTAWDCTHDPGHGCDCAKLTEALRKNRDKRIRYVIFNRRIFSSYAVTQDGVTYAAWTWRPYSGADPHTNHAHIQVLDDPVSDTSTPWNLEGFSDMSDNDQYLNYIAGERIYKVLVLGEETYDIKAFTATGGSKWPAVIGEHSVMVTTINEIRDKVAEIVTLLQQGEGSGGGDGGGLTPAQAQQLTDILSGVQALTSGIVANAAAVGAPTA